MPSCTLEAFCKVNLCLEVTGRRDDGYHTLATIFQTVSLADRLTVETRDEPGIELRVPNGGAPEDPTNLCAQAAELYREVRGWPAGVGITLHKSVPSGAGLGGGSSDAAAVLRALAKLDDDPLEQAMLREIAGRIGADVPFFLVGGTALATGRGDRITSLPDLPGFWMVLVRPELHISTGEAFGMLSATDFTDGGHASAMADAVSEGRLAEISRHVFNGFANALEERWPGLRELKQGLRKSGAVAAEITGSGSAVFGVFADHATAVAAENVFTAKGQWVRLVEPVPCGALVAE